MQGEGHLADLVEEEGAPPSASPKWPSRDWSAPVKAPFSWPKSGVDQRLGVLSHVDDDERTRPTVAEVVERVSDELLPGAGRTFDQDRRAGARRRLDA